MSNFPQIVQKRAQLQGDDVACRFFRGATNAVELLTYRSLWVNAACLARNLRDRGLAHHRAVLVCTSHQNFVVAFYACLLAGVVAVPSAPAKRETMRSRLRLICADAEAGAVIVDGDGLVDSFVSETGLALIDLRELPDATADDADGFVPVTPDDAVVAFLQYTSGSTGDPKGVAVTHGNLVANSTAIQRAMEISPESRIFTALPLFHDMGLVGGVLQMMFVGCSAGYLSPTEFVQYPERWLQILSEYKITVSGGPNFMFDMAVRAIRPEQIIGIDLSAWRVAFCGAEPIRAPVVARFVEKFRPNGFRASAFYPCYGMAESTLLISAVRVGSGLSVYDNHGSSVVDCGQPWADTDVQIVDPASSKAVAATESGEIWVRGSSVAAGYWRRPKLSAEVFQARIGDESPGYLRTGDLGFMRDGQLFVTGRLKDLIIINGKKYVPQDIEYDSERCHDALRVSGGAAFELSDARSSGLVIVFELKRSWLRRQAEWPAVIAAIHECIRIEHGLPVSDVVLIFPGALPRTSSGKVRRGQCRTDYQTGQLKFAQDGRRKAHALSAEAG